MEVEKINQQNEKNAWKLEARGGNYELFLNIKIWSKK